MLLAAFAWVSFESPYVDSCNRWLSNWRLPSYDH